MPAHESGQIVSLQLCIGHRDPMKKVESANAVTNFGLEGDRHATSEGVRTQRQVLLMDEETLREFGLNRADVRENITTSGFDLYSLKRGEQVALGGEVVLKITGHCAPCARMDELRPGLQEQLEGRRGMLASIVQGGTIKVGDAIRVLERAATS
ncbi:MAG: MOSC domain-containing protein [Ardenticatenaceae bacterium]